MAAFFNSCVSGSSGEGEGGNPQNAMRDMFGPAQVDQQIRGAISTCWMMLPPEKRTPEAIATEMRRIVERALNNLKDDAAAFGFLSRAAGDKQAE